MKNVHPSPLYGTLLRPSFDSYSDNDEDGMDPSGTNCPYSSPLISQPLGHQSNMTVTEGDMTKFVQDGYQDAEENEIVLNASPSRGRNLRENRMSLDHQNATFFIEKN